MPRDVKTELEVRVTYPTEPGRLSKILQAIAAGGGAITAHLTYRLYDRSAGFFLCERPEEAALTLRNDGYDVETETVVTVRTEDTADAFRHLVETIDHAGVAIGYSYATPGEGVLHAVFRTDDNPKTEDVLKDYLGIASVAWEPPWDEGAGADESSADAT